MAWWYKAPQRFPAVFLANLRAAALNFDTPRIIGSFPNKSEASKLAEQYRYFRWAIREKPDAMPDLTEILETFDVRTSIREDEVGFLLYLIAKPTKLSEFIRLNPDLAGEILSHCQ